MSEVKLNAESRSEFGKGASRRLRRAGRVPAVMYGHGTDPVHISLPGHETQLAARVANVLLSISVDGAAGQLALPKAIQRDPVKDSIEHIDLIIVRRGEKVTVEVPLVIIGEPGDASGVVVTDLQSIALEAEATNLPAQIEVSVEGLDIGAQILAQDLDLPEGAVFNGDPETLVVAVNAPAVEAPSEDEGAEDGEGAEGEGSDSSEE